MAKATMSAEKMLRFLHPDLAKEWHPLKNSKLIPADIAGNPNKKIWWRCTEYGHKWQASINERKSGQGCPYCADQMFEAERTDLAFTNPKLAAQWHPTKNGNLTPMDVSSGSSIKVWWLCEKGHEWQAKICSRKNGRGCPYCSGLKAIPGESDLATTHPELAAQWHPTKNGYLTPANFVAGSEKRIWWLCEKGHEWEARISERKRGKGCPYCSGVKVRIGYNDFATRYPKIAAQWHPTKNGTLTPEDITSGSGRKVWWLGECGHEWQATLSSRVYGSTGCPYCAGKKVLVGYNDLATTHPELVAQWHPTKNGALTPKDIVFGTRKKVWWSCECGHDREVKPSDKIKSNCPYCSERKTFTSNYDLATKHPDLVAQWHPTKNGDLNPSDVAISSNRKVWWQGKCGHEWQARVFVRVKGSGCPICSGHKILPGQNDLTTTHPALAAQWHPTKNGDLTPEAVKSGSNKKVWWQGECGHEWQAMVCARTRGSGCPVCTGHKILAGYNDLKTTHKKLAAQWHPTKNGDLKPQDVTKNSRRCVWWRGKCGHEWPARIFDRAHGQGCPICHGPAGQKTKEEDHDNENH